MTDMKYVMEDFFRMVTPRIMDAGRYSENGDIWLSISLISFQKWRRALPCNLLCTSVDLRFILVGAFHKDQ